jgi:23S rRNA (adenine1618-N6)-methyltransferase
MKDHPKVKTNLHPKSKHRGRYDFKALIETCPELSSYVRVNDYGDESIDFFNPDAVRQLNTALLMHFYNITYWEIPEDYLCPPIPGRADYIHYAAELLGNSNYGNIPSGNKIKCLDIGVGANCIYPIVGITEYGWNFIGADIDEMALESAKKIAKENPQMTNKIDFRLQANPKDVFYGVITKDEQVDVVICNPPFYNSLAEATENSLRKTSNLTKEKTKVVSKNFGGKNTELWCDGGENKFIRNMVRESKKFKDNCFWFTTLVSKQSNLKSIYRSLDNESATDVKTIAMGQGNKKSRIVAWTFFNGEQQKKWRESK